MTPSRSDGNSATPGVAVLALSMALSLSLVASLASAAPASAILAAAPAASPETSCMGLMVLVTPSSAALVVGALQPFRAEVLCGGMSGSENVTSSASISWSVSGTAVTVTPASGPTTLSTAVANGSATVTATANFNGLSGQRAASVTVGGSGGSPPPSCMGSLVVALRPSSAVIFLGGSTTFQVSVLCRSMTGGLENLTTSSTFLWSVSGSSATLGGPSGPSVPMTGVQTGNGTLWVSVACGSSSVESSSFFTVEPTSGGAGTSFMVSGTVSNATGSPASGALVQVVGSGGTGILAEGAADAGGTFSFLLPGGRAYQLLASATWGGTGSSTTFQLSADSSVDLTLGPSGPSHPPPASVWPPWFLPLVVTVALAAAVVGIVLGGELTELALILPVVLLYARIRRDQVLDHFVRGRVFGYIEGHPGASYSEIMDALHLANGVASYHLYVLEREKFIASRRAGSARVYFPPDQPPRAEDSGLSPVQARIMALVRESPGVSQSDIARRLGTRRQNVHYNVGRLSQAGIVAVDGWGWRKRVFPRSVVPAVGGPGAATA